MNKTARRVFYDMFLTPYPLERVGERFIIVIFVINILIDLWMLKH
jgi:hypothetical protein